MVLTGRQVRMAALKMMIFSRGNAYKNAEYIRKNNIFHHMGEGCYYHPRKLPSEPMLVSVGDNVISLGSVRGEGEYTVFTDCSYLIDIDVRGTFKQKVLILQQASNPF